MSDYALKNGSVARGIGSFIKTLISFVIVPLVILIVADKVMDMAATELGSYMDTTSMKDAMAVARDVAEDAIRYSLPFLVLSIPIGFYPRGNSARIPFKLIWAFYMAIYIFP